MIRVTHRAGRNTFVSGGLFATLFYLLFIGPLVLSVFLGFAVCWVFYQIIKGVVLLITALTNRN